MQAAAKITDKARTATRKQPDRRRHQRVELKLKGRFLFEDDDYRVETLEISCGGATVDSEFRPPVGQIIVCYFDNLGRVSARVVRLLDTGFALEFMASTRKRDKLADRLVWLLNSSTLEQDEQRDAPRSAEGVAAKVRRGDGSEIDCRVADISLTGAAFESAGPLPFVGEFVSAGKLKGEVVRVMPGEFAIRFIHKATVEFAGS